MDVYAEKLSRLKDKLICSFKLVADMIRELVYDVDGLTFLKRDPMGFGENRYCGSEFGAHSFSKCMNGQWSTCVIVNSELR